MTEDNDGNDGGTPNNVSDDGDNKHPSGKDRSVEHGNSGNQGSSPADPDGDSNGGPDKPGGAGGVDLADQDGNNGCGNDDDFEDDNNGNCGGSKHEKDEAPDTEESAPVCGDDQSMTEGSDCGDTDESIAGPVSGSPDAGDVSGTTTSAPFLGGVAAGAEVMGQAVTRADEPYSGEAPGAGGEQLVAAGVSAGPMERPATMPFTGGDVLTLLAAGLGLFVTGAFIVRLRSN